MTLKHLRLAAITLTSLIVTAPLAQARVRIDINLGNQTMHVTADGGEDYVWPISSGRAGFRTPTGSYRPQRMMAMAYSAKYHNSPMPHSIFFRGGYAIHGTMATGSLGRPASHGCVRILPANAAVLYQLVQAEGASIRILGGADAGMMTASAHRRHSREPALAYAPRLHTRTLKQWLLNPAGDQ